MKGLPGHREHSKFDEYADDTVVYILNKELIVIENPIRAELENLAKYFSYN